MIYIAVYHDAQSSQIINHKSFRVTKMSFSVNHVGAFKPWYIWEPDCNLSSLQIRVVLYSLCYCRCSVQGFFQVPLYSPNSTAKHHHCYWVELRTVIMSRAPSVNNSFCHIQLNWIYISKGQDLWRCKNIISNTHTCFKCVSVLEFE